MRSIEMDKETKLEEEILASFERGEWQAARLLPQRYAHLKFDELDIP
jgi:hypothetical protein